ncbi:MAG: hypothetical protein NT175_06945 [Bacteroidetes bacterium]|nr:hypothetical protein [Bacteroidota bacterium]
MNNEEPFEAYKNVFKEATGRNWDENLSDYILFLQLKVQEQQLVAMNQLCNVVTKFVK